MMIYLILVLAVTSVLLDLLILRLVRRNFPDRRWVGRLYLVHFLVIDLGVVVALSCYRQFSSGDTTAYMQVVMWVIFLFFVSVVPKLFGGVVALLDYPLGKIRKRRTTLFSKIGVGVALLLLGVMVWGGTLGRTRVVVDHLTLQSEKIPAAFDGYKIVFFTDLHLGNLPADNRFLKRVVRRINEQHADLVVNGGDLVNIDARELDDTIRTILSGIRATDGVYSVFGNHDLGIYMQRNSGWTPQQSVEELTLRQQNMNWTLLNNQTDYIHRGEDRISVTGVNYPSHAKVNGRWTIDFAQCDFAMAYEEVPDSLFNLLIAHTPEVWDEARGTGYADLTLSGHVHAMQLKIRLGNWVWSPARWLYDRWSGLYRESGKTLYINDGLGYVMYPMRVGTYPSVTVITLKSERVP